MNHIFSSSPARCHVSNTACQIRSSEIDLSPVYITLMEETRTKFNIVFNIENATEDYHEQ